MVTKVIVARLWPLLSNIIYPMQTAFVPSWKGLDTANLVQELLHTMSLKIDMEMAFDRLEWSFICDTLLFFRIPPLSCNVVKSCISSSSISVLFNGGALDSCCHLRGICQGDLLSSYIFIMCLEVLGCFLSGINVIQSFESTQDFQRRLLFFAEDLGLFALALKELLEY